MLVAVAGTGLTFGLWWIYFTVPAGEMLHVRRERVFSEGVRPALASNLISSRLLFGDANPGQRRNGIHPERRRRIDIARQRNPKRVADVRSGLAPWTCWQQHVDARAARS